MKAWIDSWEVKQLGPAFSTRKEYADGSVGFEAIHEVNLKITVIGNDATEFVGQVQRMLPGTTLKEIKFQAPTQPCSPQPKGRKYHFN